MLGGFGGLHVAPVEECQQLVARIEKHGVAQVTAVGLGRLEGEQLIALALEAAGRGAFQRLPASGREMIEEQASHDPN